MFVKDEGVVDVRIGDSDPGIIEGAEGGHHFQPGNLFFDGVAHGFAQAVIISRVFRAFEVSDDAVDMGAILFEFIEAEVVLDEQEDDQGGADADGEADDIDEGEGLVAPEVAEGDFEIVF